MTQGNTAEQLSRRSVLAGVRPDAGRTEGTGTAAGSGKDWHIVSLIVQAWPERVDALKKQFSKLKEVEFHGEAGPGRQIVTVEAASEQFLMDVIGLLEQSDGVIAVSLVYHQQDQGDDYV